MAQRFNFGSALLTLGQGLPAVGKAFVDEEERRRQAEKDAAALAALAEETKSKKYTQARTETENVRTDKMRGEAENKFAQYSLVKKMTEQARQTGGEGALERGEYVGPLRPDAQKEAAAFAAKSPLQQMEGAGLPAYTEVDPRIKGMVEHETTGEKLLQTEKDKEAMRQFQRDQAEDARLAREQEAQRQRDFMAQQNALNRGSKDKSDKEGIDPETGKAYTSAQFDAARYALRISEANKIVDALSLGGFNMGKISNAIMKPDKMNLIKDPKQRQYAQAARNFVNSVLRKESGAVISPSEFAEARAQYFPQVGDDVATQEQKRKNRLQQFAAMKTAAGSAYEKTQKEYNAALSETAPGGGKKVGRFSVEVE